MKAIVLHGPGQTTVDSVPTPHPGPGSITIQVLHAMVHNAAKALIKGVPAATQHLMKKPYQNTPGGYGVGRVAASGPDTTALELLRPGHLSRSEDRRGRQDGQIWLRLLPPTAPVDARCCGLQPPLARRIRSPWARRFFPSGGTDESVSLPAVLKLGKAAGLEVIASYPLERMEEAPDKGLEAGASELVVIGPQ
ncbi:hypothetical protein E5D57_006745 [Metarhizium anisopliae]|nr:hypothetical protein E5D57_006745 [Metarhizium anisopliae]